MFLSEFSGPGRCVGAVQLSSLLHHSQEVGCIIDTGEFEVLPWVLPYYRGTRIRNGLFRRGWITPVLGVCRYSDRSHFEATAAADPTSEGFSLEFPYA
eukprot:COSAG02_NODE_149_length_33622_cov_118.075948_9_plen_98_part_00